MIAPSGEVVTIRSASGPPANGGAPGPATEAARETVSSEKVASQSGWRTTRTPASRITLTARYSGDPVFLPSSSTESHEVRAPAARILTLRTEPSDEAVPGEPFRRQPEVQLSLEGGGDVREGGVTVRVALASGNGTLEGTTAIPTGGDGRACRSGLC